MYLSMKHIFSSEKGLFVSHYNIERHLMPFSYLHSMYLYKKLLEIFHISTVEIYCKALNDISTLTTCIIYFVTFNLIRRREIGFFCSPKNFCENMKTFGYCKKNVTHNSIHGSHVRMYIIVHIPSCPCIHYVMF